VNAAHDFSDRAVNYKMVAIRKPSTGARYFFTGVVLAIPGDVWLSSVVYSPFWPGLLAGLVGFCAGALDIMNLSL